MVFDRTDGKIILVTLLAVIFGVLGFYPARDWLPFQVFFPAFLTEQPFWWTVMQAGPLIASVFFISMLFIIVRYWK